MRVKKGPTSILCMSYGIFFNLHWDKIHLLSAGETIMKDMSHESTYYWWNNQNKASTWWRHQMETFSALLALCEGNPPVTGGFPTQGPVTRSFGVFYDLRPNKRLSKQSRRRWFETSSRSLWRNCNEDVHILLIVQYTSHQAGHLCKIEAPWKILKHFCF